MRKWLSKANRGIIILCAVLLFLSVYLIYDLVQSKKNEKVVLSISNQFITDCGKVLSSGENLDVNSMDLSDYNYDLNAFTRYLVESEFSSISDYYYPNDAIKDLQIEVFQNDYFRILDERGAILLSCSQVPTQHVKECSVYKYSASVTLSVNRVLELMDENGKRFSESENCIYNIDFLYVDGEWKIISLDYYRSDY